jgi:hypothetical protein
MENARLSHEIFKEAAELFTESFNDSAVPALFEENIAEKKTVILQYLENLPLILAFLKQFELIEGSDLFADFCKCNELNNFLDAQKSFSASISTRVGVTALFLKALDDNMRKLDTFLSEIERDLTSQEHVLKHVDWQPFPLTLNECGPSLRLY